MANSSIYLSPEGKTITRSAWLMRKAESPDPYVLKQFENDSVSIQFRAAEGVQSAKDIPKHFWKVFSVRIENIITTDSEGAPLVQPRRVHDIDSKDFSHREDAEGYYEKFLAKYTDSRFDAETGGLIEVGNKLTPPAPPDPDRPTLGAESPMAEQFGSW